MDLLDRIGTCIAVALIAATSSCGGGGGPGGAGGAVPAVPTSALVPQVAGITSVVAGDSRIRFEFVRPADAVQFALFAGTSTSQLLAGAPLALDPPGTSFEAVGLANGQRLRTALAVRSGSSGPWTRSGPILSVRPAPPIYVDPGAPQQGADGTEPGKAFPDLALAFIVAGGSGGGNVWMRGGDYGASTSVVPESVDVYGGFAPGFALADRDPKLHPTILRGSAANRIIAVDAGANGVVLDGLVLEGDGAATIGIDVLEAPLELRSVEVRNCSDRGIRARGLSSGDPVALRLANVAVLACGADGLSAQGALDVALFRSRFQGNVQEGVEFDDLLVDSGRTAGLEVLGCSFAGNGAEGMDVDLGVPLTAVPPGGTFELTMRDSVFELNGLSGLLVDIDYETTPQWLAKIEVAGCIARANGGSGMHFDLDSTQRTFVHRSVFAANQGQGLLVTSETEPGLAVVSASTFLGNRGGGLRAAFGNVSVAASHIVVEGNLGSGLSSPTVLSTAASTLVWLQPSFAAGLHDVGSGVADDGELARVPFAFVTATGVGPAGLAVDQPSAVVAGDVVELAADGVARDVLAIAGNALDLEPEPTLLGAAQTLAVFSGGAGVVLDHSPLPGAGVAGVGMTGVGGPFVDPGPRGSPDAAEPGPIGDAPQAWLRVASTSPPVTGPLGPASLVRIEFDRALALGSANSATVRVLDSSGVVLGAAISVVSGALELTAPPGNWPTEVRVEIDRGLVGTDGVPLAAPVVLVWR